MRGCLWTGDTHREIHVCKVARAGEIQPADLGDAPKPVGERVAVDVQRRASAGAIKTARHEGLQRVRELAATIRPRQRPRSQIRRS